MRTSQKYFFDNGRGQKLAGILDMPDGTPEFFGVFGPCFTCPKESHAAAKVCRHMAEQGAAMLRIDVTGQGESEGDFSRSNFTTRIADLQAACAALARDYEPPRLLVGHSISGTASLAAVAGLSDIEAVATIGSPADPASIIEKFRRQNLITEKNAEEIEIFVIMQKVTFQKSFIDDMLAQDVARLTGEFDRKLFIFHAPNDSIVSYDNAKTIYDRAVKAGHELVTLDDAATHLFENRKDDAIFVAEKLLGWFRSRG